MVSSRMRVDPSFPSPAEVLLALEDVRSGSPPDPRTAAYCVEMGLLTYSRYRYALTWRTEDPEHISLTLEIVSAVSNTYPLLNRLLHSKAGTFEEALAQIKERYGVDPDNPKVLREWWELAHSPRRTLLPTS